MQNIDDVIIELPEYNEKIKQQFKATSEFIRNLPLTREQNVNAPGRRGRASA